MFFRTKALQAFPYGNYDKNREEEPTDPAPSVDGLGLALLALDKRLQKIEGKNPKVDSLLRGLLDDVGDAAIRYAGARWNFIEATKASRTMTDGQKMHSLIMGVDGARRIAHEAFMDSFRIAARNVYQATKKQGPLVGEIAELMDGDRRDIGHAAVVYVAKLLREKKITNI